MGPVVLQNEEVLAQSFCDEWPAVTSQVYHSNAQQLQCHRGQRNTQELRLNDPYAMISLLLALL